MSARRAGADRHRRTQCNACDSVGDLPGLPQVHLPGGVKITKGKLRGVPSNGMAVLVPGAGSVPRLRTVCVRTASCSCPRVPVGEDIKKVLGLDDWVFDFEITSNRPDCLSVIGLARETAATFDRPFSVKTPGGQGVGDDINKYMSVEVRTPTCVRATPPALSRISRSSRLRRGCASVCTPAAFARSTTSLISPTMLCSSTASR